MPELVASNGTRFRLRREAALVGRMDPDAVLPSPDVDLSSVEGGHTVSRHHVQIFRSGDDWRLKVLAQARNATMVAGRLLPPEQETVLQDGDEIKLGTVTVLFQADREQPALDPNATLVRTGPALAELRADNVRVPLAVGEGRELTLGRTSDDGSYQPDIDLRAAPGGKTVSRRHGLLLHRGNTWYLRVEAEVTNPTYLNGAQLEQGQEVALADGDHIRMGAAVATFHQDREAEYTDLLDLVLGPPTDFALQAGAQQALPLKLVNFSGRVDWFIIEVRGVPPAWCNVIVPNGRTGRDGLPQVRLDTAVAPVPTPTATSNMTLVFAPPRRPDAAAGIYPVLITATSLDNRRFRRTSPGQLELLPYTSVRLNVEPSQRSGRGGHYQVTLDNDGNAPATVSLGVEADPSIEATLEHPQMTLANGGSSVVDLGLRVKRRPWFGPETAHVATVRSLAGEQVQAQAVSLVCAPRVPLWLQRLLGRVQNDLKPVFAALVILAAILVAGHFWLFPPDVKVEPDAALVASGHSTTLSWDIARGRSEAVLEGTAVSQVVPVPRGTMTVSADATSEFKVTAKNLIGLGGSGSAKVQVLRVVHFAAAPETIKQPGDPVTLEWATENATLVKISPADDIGSVAISGKVTVKPQASTVYHLVATNEQYQLSVTQDARVAFGAPRITQFQPDQSQVYPGGVVVLSWKADGFTTLSLKSGPNDPGEDVTRRSSIQVRPVRPTTFTLVAANSDGATDTSDLRVEVVPIKAPTWLAVKPIAAGESATLAWQVAGVNDQTRIILRPDGTDVSGRTTADVRPGHTTEYQLELTTADGQTVPSEPLTVAVLPSVQDFRVVPAALTEGEPVVLTWNVLDADSVTVTRDDGLTFRGQAADEVRDHPPASVTSYTLKARNASGESSDSQKSTVKVKVQAPTPVPVAPIPPSSGV